MKDEQRRHLLVDPAVQGVLIARTVLYWAFCLLTITLILLIWRVVADSDHPFHEHIAELWSTLRAPMAASLVVLCLVIVDLIRVSNRFTGPLCRLRREMRRLAMGEDVKPVHFRDDDFWPELSVHFNAIAARLRAAEHVDLGSASLANGSVVEEGPSGLHELASLPDEEPVIASAP